MEKMLRDKKTIFLFMFPATLLFVLFVPVPVVSFIVLSFYKWNLIGAPKFIGLDNFRFLFQEDMVFWGALKNTMIFVGASVLLQIPMAFLLANLLSKKLKGSNLFRNILFLPVTLSGVIVSLMWYFIYHPEIGLLNQFLNIIGVPIGHYSWLGNADTVLIAIIVSIAWQWVGYHMVILISGITTIPSELFEAAKIDGANEWQVVKNITLPLIMPMLQVSTILITTSSLKSFDSIYVMSKGGPNHASDVLASLMYSNAFQQLKFGYGASISVVLLVMCVLASVLISRLFSSRNPYNQEAKK